MDIYDAHVGGVGIDDSCVGNHDVSLFVSDNSELTDVAHTPAFVSTACSMVSADNDEQTFVYQKPGIG